MAAFLMDKDPLGNLSARKVFDVVKIDISITIDDDRAFQSLYYSNIKTKETIATLKSGKVIKVKTISNKDTISRIKYRIATSCLLSFIKGVKQDLRMKLKSKGYLT